MKKISRVMAALSLVSLAGWTSAQPAPSSPKDAVTPVPTPASLAALRMPSAAAADPNFIQGGPAELLLSQQFILHSKNVGADYLIQVIEPIPFAPIKGADVLYLLDGGSFIGLAVSVSQSLQMAMTTRPIYVVAVTFLGKTFPELVAERSRDLAHDPVPPWGWPRFDGLRKPLLVYLLHRELRSLSWLSHLPLRCIKDECKASCK